MEELKTLEDLWAETETYNEKHTPIEIQGIRRDDIGRMRDTAKRHIARFCENMKLDETRIEPGHYNDEGIFTFTYDMVLDHRQIDCVGLVSWIKYFFNLE